MFRVEEVIGRYNNNSRPLAGDEHHSKKLGFQIADFTKLAFISSGLTLRLIYESIFLQ
jgi:hypothetical protein